MPWSYSDNEYLKLFRKVKAWEWWDEPKTFCLFMHLLVMANWKAGEWHGIHYEPGELITSIPSLVAETGLSAKQVRTAIDNLVKSGEIENKLRDERAGKKLSRNRIISIKNWSMYQGEGRQTAGKGQASGRQTAGKGQASGRQRAADIRSIEDKKIRSIEDKNNNKARYYDNEELNTAFIDFLDYRKSIKKPLSTERGISVTRTKLNNLSGNNPETAIKIIEQSIERGWQGLFPLKEDSKQDGAGNDAESHRGYTIQDAYGDIDLDQFDISDDAKLF